MEAEWESHGDKAPQWGQRFTVLNDLSPAAAFIATNYTLPFSLDEFAEAGRQLLADIETDVGWMYETLHSDGRTTGRINYVVWSEVFSCPDCAGDIVFYDEALDKNTNRVRTVIACPHCAAQLKKKALRQRFETVLDPATGEPWSRITLKPVLVNYDVGSNTFEKSPDKKDSQLLDKVAALNLPEEVPTNAFPFDDMWEAPRLRGKGFSRIHHLFSPRAAHSLAALFRRTTQRTDRRMRNMLLYFAEQAIWGMSVLARYAPTHYSQVNQYLSGAYYVGSQIVDVSPWYILEGKLKRLTKAFESVAETDGTVFTSTGSCSDLQIPDSSVDYVFTDPPFGDNFPYAELNYLVESWHRVISALSHDVIVDRSKKNKQAQKSVADYQRLMKQCFDEYFRILKAGRWLTVVFSNSKNIVWHAIQESLGEAGFVVADVRTLDKQQHSFRQVTSAAVKQDLVISAYKPTAELIESFSLGESNEANAWAFVGEHLGNVPICVELGGKAEIVVERTAQMIYDRMVGFHVQRGQAVPLSNSEFLIGLVERFPSRDDMYFLSRQTAEYDRRRVKIKEMQQLSLFVTDEATAIQWVRQELRDKPQKVEDMQPAFMRELQAWAKHEEQIELRDLLELNFICYDGDGEVPGQVHGYLSSNYKELRKLDKDDPKLVAKAKDRWYVPDPRKEADLEKIRHRTLMKEFDEYKQAKGRLKLIRTEALRAGFKECWQNSDYQTIVDMVKRVKDEIIQEDMALLMYYDNAVMLTGG